MSKYFGFDISDHNPYDFADKIRDEMDIDQDKYPNMYKNIIYATMVLFKDIIRNYYPQSSGIMHIEDWDNLRMCYLAKLDMACTAYFNHLQVPYLDELVEDHCDTIINDTESDDLISQELSNYLDENKKWLTGFNYEWIRIYRYHICYKYRDELVRIKILSLYFKNRGPMLDFRKKKQILNNIDELTDFIVLRELNTSNDINIRDTIRHILKKFKEGSELSIFNMRCNILSPDLPITVDQLPDNILKCNINYEMI